MILMNLFMKSAIRRRNGELQRIEPKLFSLFFPDKNVYLHTEPILLIDTLLCVATKKITHFNGQFSWIF